jgi:TolB protein
MERAGIVPGLFALNEYRLPAGIPERSDNMNRRLFLATSCGAIASPFLARLAQSAEPVDASIVPGNPVRLGEPGRGDNRATYSPDGSTLIFASTRSGRSQIWAMDQDGGSARQLHQSSGNDYGRVASNGDGTCLCFSSDRSGQNAVYVLDRRNGRIDLVSDPNFWSFGPTWSSSDCVAFFSKKGGNAINVWTVRPDGSELRQITNQPGESRQPWWSPDGRMLALSADHGSRLFQIWILQPDGTAARCITQGGNYQQPFWSPDGKRIAVSAKLDGAHFRIYVMNSSDGNGLEQIEQPASVDNVHPAWSPDGRSIVFTSGTESASALWRFSFA